MEIINLTPHSLRLVTKSGEMLTLSKSNKNAPIRINSRCVDLGDFNGVPLKEITPELQTAQELPVQEDNKIYIVSRMVADVYRHTRHDFFYPYDLRRSETGLVIGCYSLARFS